jgi:4-diphosphocytidyl-2-C-methyl-D-erythritol kinase
MTTADSRAGGRLRVDAWAKVNLTLHVTGRRADGYHELDSLVVFAAVGDTLEIIPAGDLSLTVDGPFATDLDDPSANLVMRAADALRARFSLRAGAHLHLTKRLPVAAGIGGGSCDAAAALRGLNEFWRLGAATAELAALGAALGADVPVCLAARPSFVAGVGERIDPAPGLPRFWFVLVNPGVPLSTPAVFKSRAGRFSKALRWRDSLRDVPALAVRLREGRNDLEAPAILMVPEIGDVLSALRATPSCHLARMSGSGATCFGLFGDEDAATAAAARIREAWPAWWVSPAPVVSAS